MVSRTRPETTTASGPDAAAPRPRRWPQRTALIAGLIIVIALHFRPWEVAFLEEWGFAFDWQRFGLWGVIELMAEWTVSRPLHLVPTLIGLTIGNGAPGAIFIVLAAVAAGQLLLVLWALRPVVSSFWMRWALGMFLALHPVWAGGYLQRFLPAQTAALLLVVSMGLLIRWLLDGRRRSLVWACVVMFLALCVYPGPAAVGPLMALALALGIRSSTNRRKIAAVVAMTGTSALMTLYVLVISRIVVPDSAYEQSVGVMTVGLRDGITMVGTTLLSTGLPAVLSIIAVAVLGAVCSLTGATSNSAGWLISGVALASPLTAVVFYGNTGWLGDIDRLAYVISLTLFVALCVWAANTTGVRVRLEVVTVIVIVTVSVLGGVRGVLTWQPWVQLQHELLSEIGPVMAEAEGDEIVAVVDRTGALGTVGAFPAGFLMVAAIYWNDDGTRTIICPPPPEDPSDEAVCWAGETARDFRFQKTVQVPQGEIDVYIAQPGD